jgi:6-phosphofructokinase 1
MRIGVLTGGGDVPGLNTCIKAIVNHAEDRGFEVYGFRRGWAGPPKTTGTSGSNG